MNYQKTKRYAVAICVLCLAALLGFQLALDANSVFALIKEKAVVNLSKNFGDLPLTFESNHGQTNSMVKFLSRGKGYYLFLNADGAMLSIRNPNSSKPIGSALIANRPEHYGAKASDTSLVHILLLGTSPSSKIFGEDELPGKTNYFRNKDPKNWHTKIPTFRKVRYKNVYPGIDLIFYGSQQTLEYDFLIFPGSDYSAIQLEIKGAEKLSIDEKGDLALLKRGGGFIMHAPKVYQVTNGKRQNIDANYVLTNHNQVRFQVASYDKNKPLIIDPILSYSTYLGGTIEDKAFDIAVDDQGNAYVIGVTDSVDFPTVNPMQTNLGGLDVFVAKINATGTALIYSTYFGGHNTDMGYSIAVDSSGNAYFSGGTFSDENSFPITNGAFQSSHSGGTDAFVAKLNPTGSALLFSTFLGGSEDENRGNANDIAVDSHGNVHIIGETRSTDFPTKNPLQSTKAGDYDVFVTKLNPLGSELIYSTYLGGSDDHGHDRGLGIAVDDFGNAYICGDTRSTDFPTANAFQPTHAGDVDVFIAKLNPLGSELIYSTYLGGIRWEGGYGFSIDNDGNALVTGNTQSINFPIKNALQENFAGGLTDAFVAKLNSSGSLMFSTYLGGTDNDSGAGIAADHFGNSYVSGSTFSNDFPTVDALQPMSGGMLDVFVTKLNSTGTEIIYSTYLGGTMDDGDQGIQRGDIAIDHYGHAYVASYTRSADFPTVNPLQAELEGNYNAFIAKISPIYNEITIDIKPGSYPNSINLKSKGKVPVAILTTDYFDAYDVAPGTVNFAGANPLRWRMEDVDNDSDDDMLFHFKTRELDLTKESTEATLEGETFGGIQITGTDSVKIVPKCKWHGKNKKWYGKNYKWYRKKIKKLK